MMHLLSRNGWIVHPTILHRVACNSSPGYTQVLLLGTTLLCIILQNECHHPLKNIAMCLMTNTKMHGIPEAVNIRITKS